MGRTPPTTTDLFVRLFRRLRAGQGSGVGSSTSTTSSALTVDAARGGRRGGARGALALFVVHRRRVPGHHAAAGPAARAVAGRAAGPVRGRGRRTRPSTPSPGPRRSTSRLRAALSRSEWSSRCWRTTAPARKSLALANKLLASTGSDKQLLATQDGRARSRPCGPSPSAAEEEAYVVARVKALLADGVAAERDRGAAAAERADRRVRVGPRRARASPISCVASASSSGVRSRRPCVAWSACPMTSPATP